MGREQGPRCPNFSAHEGPAQRVRSAVSAAISRSFGPPALTCFLPFHSIWPAGSSRRDANSP
jgi:hypothetical protein